MRVLFISFFILALALKKTNTQSTGPSNTDDQGTNPTTDTGTSNPNSQASIMSGTSTPNSQTSKTIDIISNFF